MAHSSPTALLLAVIALTVPVAVPVIIPVALAQDSRIPHDEYFRLVGSYEDYAALETFLATRLAERRPDLGEERRDKMAEFFAFVMTAAGLTTAGAAVLEAEGIDIVRAITADTRPFGEQSLLADLVIVGNVLSEEAGGDTDDGYRSSALVEVRSTLKGSAPADTIVIRLRRPRTGDRRDIRPEMGRSYLLLLSNGMYRYGAANHAARNEGWLPSEMIPHHYSIYRIYPLENGRLDWGGLTHEDTDRAFQEIRRVDDLLGISRENAPGH